MEKMDSGIVPAVSSGGRRHFFRCRPLLLPLLSVSGFFLFSAENFLQKTFLLLRLFFPGGCCPGISFLHGRGEDIPCRLPAHLPDDSRHFFAHRLADVFQFVKRAHGR
ncbi:hypothetical protein KQP69_13590 [Bacteroides thetaiotaomicron]|nr:MULTISPECIES: hypothetical protein [Bacteroides]MCS2629121.1 hypothetical protein [Bacteroides thetaiotaomicron]MCS2827202.1 hypothetical protein [Bacteroides thetaiotaomicron]MCS2870373.1 hypothetical protein [Bacteroides xylanisolvens]MDC7299811.1 hypothetical protein [Bacteroides thetaiotaomicron]UML59490.1 hypothetical protein MJ393_13350 [Bacteroides thetaiotaomicron]